MQIDLNSVWMDPAFYALAALFVLAVFLLIFSIRKYLEMSNKSAFEEIAAEAGELQDELPMSGPEAAETAEDPLEDRRSPAPEACREAAAEVPAGTPVPSKAEEFVKGLYQGMSSLDARMKNIEASLGKTGQNKDFAVTFLEDMLSDLESLDKEKIKARIEFLLRDLKK